MQDLPDHGGRVLFVRDAVDGDGVRYRIELKTKDEVFRSALRIASTEGTIRLEPFTPEPPAWLRDAVEPLARTLARGRREGPWPRRVHRWRAERPARG